MGSVAQPTSPTRLQELRTKYGAFGAIAPYFFGEKPPTLSEDESRLPGYAQAIIYVTSLVTLFVFGTAELFLLFKYGFAPVSILLIMPLVLLVIMVYAMDKSTARTIPRIPLLAQRRQYGMLAEHMIYAAAVGAVEFGTFVLFLYTIEDNVQALLHGQSLVPAGSIWIWLLIGARALLLVWTAVHAHFTTEPLPVQWGTVERKFLKLIGGSVMEDIGALNFTLAPMDGKLLVMDTMLSPVERAPFSWNRRARRAAQAKLDRAHRAGVIEAVKKLAPTSGTATPQQIAQFGQFQAHLEQFNTQLSTLSALPAQMTTLAQQVAALQLAQEAEDATAEMDEEPTLHTSAAPARIPSAVSLPRIGTNAYTRYLRGIMQRMIDDEEPITVYALTEKLGISASALMDEIRRIIKVATGKLASGKKITDPIILKLGMLVEQPAAHA